jgi:hypothetical protein
LATGLGPYSQVIVQWTVTWLQGPNPLAKPLACPRRCNALLLLIVLWGKTINRELLIDLIMVGYTETFYYRGRGDRTNRIGVFRFIFTYHINKFKFKLKIKIKIKT